MSQIFGTPFADTLQGTPDADQLLGLGGDDHLYGGDGDDQLLGDAGHDVLEDWKGRDTFDGGEGNDLLMLYAAPYAAAFLNATGDDVALGGPGNDMLVVRGVGLSHTLSGGSGSDFFSFGAAAGALAPAQLGTFTLTDFAQAAEDRIMLAPGSLPYAWQGQAPAGFTASEGQALGTAGGAVGIWTAAQGADALLWVDLNANGLVDTRDLRLLLQGQAPLGPAALGPGVLGTTQGTPGADVLVGSALDDMILGNGGQDVVDGGDGIDVIVTLDGDDTLRGGNNRDQLAAGSGRNTVDGGNGDDFIDFDGDAASHTTASGGAGRDTYLLHPGGAQAVVTDFEPGAQGDLIDVSALLTADGAIWPPSLDPFSPAAGTLRLVAHPGATDLQWDRTGAANGAQWQTVVTLQGTPAFALTPDNIQAPAPVGALSTVPGNPAPTVAQPVPNLTVDEDSAVGFIPSLTTFADNSAPAELFITATRGDGSPLPAWLHFSGGAGTYNGVPGIGQFTGTPANGDVGVLDVKLTATDPQGASVADTFTLTVRNVNDAPTVAQVPAAITATAGIWLDWTLPAGTFADEDAGDVLLLSASTAQPMPPLLLPSWLTFDAASGRLFGMPGPLDGGTLQLRFTALDRGGATASVDVPLAVQVPNQAPVATADSASTLAGTTVTVPVLANDSDADAGQTLRVTGTGAPRAGSVLVQPDGTVLYTPRGTWNGVDSFSYTVGDGWGGTAGATVTVTVQASLVGTDAGNSLAGGTAADSIDARGGNDVVNAGAGDDFVRGGDGRDTLYGGAGQDTLLGEAGIDTLLGQEGGDTLVGGPGNDRVYTGTSNGRGDGSPDLVVFNQAPTSSGEADTVYGLEANGMDRLVLDPAVFAALQAGVTTGVDADEFRAASSVAALDGNDHLLFDTRSNQLYFDVDGSGPAAKVLMATLVNLVGTLDASDFSWALPPGV